MPVYSYRALDSKGKTVRGVLDADSPLRARTKLRTDGLFPIEVHPTSAPRVRTRTLNQLKRILTPKRNALKLLAPVTRQMATLLTAGLPVVQALDTIQEQTEDHDFRQILALIKDRVTSGESLAEALESHSDLFPAEYIHLVRAGEMSGALGIVLDQLAKNLEQRQARRAKVYSALTYPAFMTVVGAGVLLFLISFVVPTMTGLFEDLNAVLPLPTRILLGVAGILRNYWWLLLLILVGLIVLAFRLLRNEDRFRFFEKLIFHMPVIGGLFQKLLLAQVLRSLALMSSGGVALTTALHTASQGLGRSNYALALETARQKISQGRSLAEGLAASGLFPPMVRRMVAVGETGGALEEMLTRLAQAYEEETDQVMSTLTSMVEPVIIVFMGLVVGFIVLAILLPIFELSGLIG